ncbi:hypothetical protein HYFRA_00011773 [Hymenoscyphus fraxineus]|uniref:Uncharacterized protein n=1 Tax=Hymenoscyphus fraxineus TaxID=746836 RepID=A0A9N9PYL8_9HELO|nr:hypothetical protein HYFRA_00011773 [Hymenoscyphus fraxineus]
MASSTGNIGQYHQSKNMQHDQQEAAPHHDFFERAFKQPYRKIFRGGKTSKTSKKTCSICSKDHEQWEWSVAVLKPCRHEFYFDCILARISSTLRANSDSELQHSSTLIPAEKREMETTSLACPIPSCSAKIEGIEFDTKIIENLDSEETDWQALLSTTAQAYFEAREKHLKVGQDLRPFFVDLLENYPRKKLSLTFILKNFSVWKRYCKMAGEDALIYKLIGELERKLPSPFEDE